MTFDGPNGRAMTPVQPSPWEEAYLRFETPAQEIRKFKSRLVGMGAAEWPRDAQIVELFCGRGNGLRALHDLGFSRVEGVDLSPTLVRQYRGPGTVVVGDCRRLPFRDASRDILIVQGGLHHLMELPRDLDDTLAEAARVLRPAGRFVAAEPWDTPFLRAAHLACRLPLARMVSGKVDALATMIEHEQLTYHQWLARPQVILASIQRTFAIEHKTVGWGKLMLVARQRAILDHA
jgi:ubiquinone/menaquinone biosynthesis C-methylase UbiE